MASHMTLTQVGYIEGYSILDCCVVKIMYSQKISSVGFDRRGGKFQSELLFISNDTGLSEAVKNMYLLNWVLQHVKGCGCSLDQCNQRRI